MREKERGEGKKKREKREEKVGKKERRGERI